MFLKHFSLNSISVPASPFLPLLCGFSGSPLLKDVAFSVCLRNPETHYENVNLQKDQKGRAELIIPRCNELEPKQEEKKVSNNNKRVIFYVGVMYSLNLTVQQNIWLDVICFILTSIFSLHSTLAAHLDIFSEVWSDCQPHLLSHALTRIKKLRKISELSTWYDLCCWKRKETLRGTFSYD